MQWQPAQWTNFNRRRYERFCKICEGVNRYNKTKQREPESDILELIDNFGGMLLDRPERIGFNPDEAMAFGDDLNDISMMNSVYGVAMGNAFDDLKTMAKEVVSTTNNESGISKILNRIVEERKQS